MKKQIESISSKKSSYFEEVKYFVCNHGYMFALIAIAVLCYGYSAMNTTIGIDDLEGDRYIGEGNAMLSAGRFGMNLLAGLLGYGYAEPMNQPYIKITAAMMLVLAAVQFCVLFRRVWGDRISLYGYGIFSCLLISYPLINEIWEYNGANAYVCAGYLLAASAAYLVYDALHQQGLSRMQKGIRFAFAALFLLVVCSSYESLASVYVFVVFCILTMQQMAGEKLSVPQIIRRGLVYALPLVMGVVLRVGIHKVLQMALNLSPRISGDTIIRWGRRPFAVVLRQLMKDIVLNYGVRGCMYFPILELAISVNVFVILLAVVVVRLRRPGILLTGGGMLLSLVLLSILQGVYSPYRTCQVFAMMVAVIGMALYEMIRHCDRKKIVTGVCAVLMLLLCLRQAAYLSHLLTLDHIRSEAEAEVIRTIGKDLEQNFPGDKPVIMLGSNSYVQKHIQNIQDQVTANVEDYPFYAWFQAKKGWEGESAIKYVDSNINSVIGWAMHAFLGDGPCGASVGKLFRYYGFDFSFEVSGQQWLEAFAYLLDEGMPTFPQDGYIKEMPDYILVNFSLEKEG